MKNTIITIMLIVGYVWVLSYVLHLLPEHSWLTTPSVITFTAITLITIGIYITVESNRLEREENDKKRNL